MERRPLCAVESPALGDKGRIAPWAVPFQKEGPFICASLVELDVGAKHFLKRLVSIVKWASTRRQRLRCEQVVGRWDRSADKLVRGGEKASG